MLLAGPRASDHDRVLGAGGGKASTLRQRSMVATSLATQALMLGTTGRVWMESAPLLSSQGGSGRVWAEG
jgi:hypothetical protein